MIQKAKLYPDYEFVPEKYKLDHFHNPYTAKLNVKVTPRTSLAKAPFQFINPLQNNNNLYLSNTLPLFRNERFRFGLLWRQYVTNKFARTHIGVTLEHKILDDYKFKTNLMTGTTSLVNAQLTKTLKNNVDLFFGYSGFFETSNIYNSFGLGLRKGMYSLLLTHKMGDDTEFRMNASRELYQGVNIGAGVYGNFLEPEKTELNLSLSQQVDRKSTTSVGLTYNSYYRELGVKAEYERHLTPTQKVVISSEYLDKTSVIYLGFKNYNFNFIVPVAFTDSPLPLIFGAVCFGLTYLYRKTRSKHQHIIDEEDEIKQKTEEERIQQLKLIGQKAADNYEKERLNPNGLLVEEVYVGPEDELKLFMDNPERGRLLLRSEEHKNKFVDLTVTFRFYVCKGELKLRKGDKSKLLGFFRKSKTHTKLGIRYMRNNRQQLKHYDIDEPIALLRPK